MSEEYTALDALLDYGQADMEGIIVTTSRQAIHEVAAELTALRTSNQELREALEPFAAYADALHGMGGITPRTGAYCATHGPTGSAEIRVEDFAKARTTLSRHGGEKG